MKFFYSALERDALERAHAEGSGGAATAALALAWSIRQLEPARALTLLEPHADDPAVRPWFLLIRAEQLSLQPDLSAASDLLNQAQSLFRSQSQALGLRLSLWIEAQLRADCGSYTDALACYARLHQESKACQDVELTLAAHFAHTQLMVITDLEQARPHIDAAQPPDNDTPFAQSIHAVCMCSFHTQIGQLSDAITWGIRAHDLFVETGHIRRAIITCCLLTYCFNSLGDQGNGLNWIELGLKEAEPRNWTGMRLACLTQMGGVLTKQQQLPAAQAVFEQGLALLPDTSMDRNSTLLRAGMAEVLLRQGKPAEALPLLAKMHEAGLRSGQVDLVIEAVCGESQARFELGQREQGLTLAKDALKRSQVERYAAGEQELRRHLARMHMKCEPADAQQAKAVLSPIFDLCESDQDLPFEVWQEMGRIEAALGHHQEAYEHASKALERGMAQQKAESQQRSLAMQAQLQVQQVRHENEQLLQRHADEKSRYVLLQKSHQTLATITDIGRSLTALRDVPSLFEALHAQLGRLLMFDTLFLVALNEETQRLHMVAGIENGTPMQAFDYALDDTESLSAQCAREKNLLVIQQGVSTAPLPGTRSMASMLFAPLLIGDRVTGVLSVQTLPAEAFGEREQQLLLMLAAYLAIAIDNVMAYQRVARLQAELSERQRLAALGGLVAGVAHELNTPLGNALLAVSTLRDAGVALEEQLQGGAVRRAQLAQSALCIRSSAELASRNLNRAASLIDAFKGLAAQDTLMDRQGLRLQDLVPQASQALREPLTASRLSVHMDLGDAPPVLADANILADVVQALTMNVLEHAQARHLCWSTRVTAPHAVELVCTDDGIGMSEDIKSRIFDPFFSTRFGQGSSGLGLALVMHKVRVLLGGDMGVESQPGQGSSFWVRLERADTPLGDVAPDLGASARQRSGRVDAGTTGSANAAPQA